MEADGETPWEACRREVREEVGLVVEDGRLVAVDFLRPKPSKPGGMRFLFDCGVLPDAVLAPSRCRRRSSPNTVWPSRRRRSRCSADRCGGASGRHWRSESGCVYLEDGRPV